MSSIKFKTIGGEMLDAIAHKHYQGRVGGTEAIVNDNIGLARLGPVLPAGLEISLPDLPKIQEEEIRLWD